MLAGSSPLLVYVVVKQHLFRETVNARLNAIIAFGQRSKTSQPGKITHLVHFFKTAYH